MMAESSKFGSRIYSGGSRRPAGLVVGPAGPTQWPSGFLFRLVVLCFILKEVISSVGAPFGGEMIEWRRVGMEVMEVMGGG